MRENNPILTEVDAAERDRMLAEEAAARASGEWGAWETAQVPRGTVPGQSWCLEVTVLHRNRVFTILERAAGNGVRHLAITSRSQARPNWREMQRIKDELGGPHATAVEVYPPHNEIVDGADLYHLWILPGPLPFSLYR